METRGESEILIAGDRNVNRAGLIQLHQDRTEDKGRRRACRSGSRSVETCGVEPTRKPVFKSCEIVPPFDDAMQTMPPMESAVTK